MRRVVTFLLTGLLAAVIVDAEPVLRGTAPKPAPAAPPTAADLRALQAEAARGGWEPVARRLRATALDQYARGVPSAQDWYYLYRWADLFALTGGEATADWRAQVERQKAPYPPLELDPAVAAQPLAGLWPEDLRAYALSTPGFSAEVFTLWSPLDQPVIVMQILAAIWRHDPAAFRDYASLALAIALVYDVPPPSSWPHHQVSPAALPRQLPPPVDAFAFFVKSDRRGATLQRLGRLSAAELKFVVDTCTPFAELAWAQTSVDVPLAQLDRLYGAVRYRRDRQEGGVAVWPGETYRLPEIAEQGGICIDQAYFAATVGKAKGVPTLLFRGATADGRHAWFGFRDGGGRWRLDCGREAGPPPAAGAATDPQTWSAITDDELAFLAEGFHRLPLYNTSRMHEQFADLYLRAGSFAAAARAARAAVNCEPRNLEAWNTLVMAEARLKMDPKQFEALLREGARAFQRYPELAAQFKGILARSLRARGQTSEADVVRRGAGQEPAAGRSDPNASQAEAILQQSIDNEDIGRAIVTYYRVLSAYGRGGGPEFFDRVVRPFVNRLLDDNRPQEAIKAIAHARSTLRIEPDSQLDVDLNELAERARQAMR